MPEIRPIKELRDTSKISDLCNSLNEPVFITKNGYGDMVIMSMKTYEQNMARLDVYKKLAEAEAEIESGVDLLDGDDIFHKLKENPLLQKKSISISKKKRL